MLDRVAETGRAVQGSRERRAKVVAPAAVLHEEADAEAVQREQPDVVEPVDPDRDEVPVVCGEQLVVEYYSR